MYDNADTLKILNDDELSRNMSGEEYLATANAYLKQHGITIESNPTVTYASDVGPIDIAAIPGNRNIRSTIKGIIEFYGDKPRELSELLEVERILLIEQNEEGTPIDAVGYIQPGFKSDIGAAFVMNTSALKSTMSAKSAVAHELIHRLHFKLKGDDMYDDNAFVEATGNLSYGKVGPEPAKGKPDTRKTYGELAGYIMLEEYRQQRQEILNKNRETGDCKTRAPEVDANLEALGKKVRYPSWYAREVSPVEHIAELNILNPPQYQFMLDEHLPHINKAFLYQFARFYQAAPEVASYLATIAERPQTYRAGDMPKITEASYAVKKCAWYLARPELLTRIIDNQERQNLKAG